jgi:transcription elongation factor/antiterminator RfaH
VNGNVSIGKACRIETRSDTAVACSLSETGLQEIRGGRLMTLWYIVQTKPRKEKEAATYLSTMAPHLQIFNPLMEDFCTLQGKIEKVLQPLFPGYFFVAFDLEQDFTLVRWSRGIKKILGFGGHPASVSEAVIKMIMQRAGRDGIVRRSACFEPNDRIRIKSGPLKEFSGIFERWLPDRERVRILLNLIGYQPAIEIHFSMLEKVA